MTRFKMMMTVAWQHVRMVSCVPRGTEEWESLRARARKDVEAARFLAKDAWQKQAWSRLKNHLDSSDE